MSYSNKGYHHKLNIALEMGNGFTFFILKLSNPLFARVSLGGTLLSVWESL